jgi:hypothetical protein
VQTTMERTWETDNETVAGRWSKKNRAGGESWTRLGCFCLESGSRVFAAGYGSARIPFPASN